MSDPVELLAVGLPAGISKSLSARLSGVAVTETRTMREAITAARASVFQMIVVSDAAASLKDADIFSELKEACGSRPFRVAYCADPPSDPAHASGMRDAVKVERIFFRPIDLEEMLRELARAIGVELLPPDNPSASITEPAKQLAAVWERFREATLARIDVLEDAALALLENCLSEDLRASAGREAHKLAGSSGTFGFPRASQLAREIEQRFARGGLEPGDAVLISEHLLLLRRDLEGAPLSPGPSHSDANVSKRRRVLILEPDKSARERLVMEAEGRGLSAIEAGNVAAARAAIGGSPVEAAIIGFEIRDDNHEALDLLEELQQLDHPVPTVAVVPRGSFADRVEIARRGAGHRLEYPLSPSAAIDATLAALHEARGAKPTVLAVDDDPHILEVIRAFLTPRGMRVETVSDPLLFWQRLDETDPDVVILDIDMPQVSGIELCRVLRNDERWTTLPILFLTARSDPASIQRVFAAGADDHVGKPISESELVMRLNNRLERIRQVREQAEVDPVTRVATRRKSVELMRRLTKLARRNSETFSVSVVDVDRFKAINSTYGYASGDDVLRHIGHLLVRSLRAEDTVGRWDADEFVLGFYGSGKTEAAVQLESILAGFSAHAFRSDDARSFHASFSAGVAQLPDDGTEVEALIAAAEEAMREARFDDAQKVRCAGAADLEGVEYADIALIDDDDALIGLLRHGLETAGFRVRSFGDGEAAVAALAGEKPALRARVIILDVGLPTLNGYDVLRRLSRDGITRATKVIMLTTRNTEEDVLSGLGLGAIDHVNKPFSLPVLIRKVSSAVDGRVG